MKKLSILLINMVGLMCMGVASTQESANDQRYTQGQGVRTFLAGPDCNKYGFWDAVTRTCTLATDLTGSISIQVDDATLDCAGHKLMGPGSGFGTIWSAGIFISDLSENVTIKNCDISGYEIGIFAPISNSHRIESNYIHDCPIGIRLSEGSGNQILNNTVVDVINSIGAGEGSIISGNTVDTGEFGISARAGSEITNNDITRQVFFAIFVTGSFSTVADNYIHESSGIRVGFFTGIGPTTDNLIAGNVIENGTGCGPDPFCDSGISLTAHTAQVQFSNAFGEGFMDNNTITGNIIRNFPGAGIQFDNAGNNNVVSDNIITENGGGILLTHRCPDCEYKFMRNDIFNNGGTPLVSLDSVWSQDFMRTLLGPLAVDIVGDDGMGNPIGNYWGRDCPSAPYFIAGVDSNDASVVDSNPFGIPVAGLANVPTPPACP